MQKTHNGPLVLYPCQFSPQSLIYNIFHFITFPSLAFVIDLPVVRKVRNGAACRNGDENSRVGGGVALPVVVDGTCWDDTLSLLENRTSKIISTTCRSKFLGYSA